MSKMGRMQLKRLSVKGKLDAESMLAGQVLSTLIYLVTALQYGSAHYCE